MPKSSKTNRSTHGSLWSATCEIPDYPRLQKNLRTDVCVIGAGIAGVTTAYLLAKEGKKVVLIDDGAIGNGMTSVTSAHLSYVLDRRFYEIEQLHGEKGVRLAAESHLQAIDRIESNVNDESIDCDFQRVDGYLFLGPDDTEKTLEKELEAAHHAGLERQVSLEREGMTLGRCLKFTNLGQFHPLKYLVGLAKSFQDSGGHIFSHTHADSIESGPPGTVHCGKHRITADFVVVATNTPINNLLAIHTKQAPYISYVIAAPIRRDAIRRALYWDTADPFHYIRLYPHDQSYDLLIVGGEDHKTGQASDMQERLQSLETWARRYFPAMEEVVYSWSGQVMESNDGLAYIGHNPHDQDNIFIITGDSGVGLTHGTIGGMLITDLIMGRANPWTSLYDPTRINLRAAKEFTKEALNMAGQYTDWITPGDVASVDQIKHNSGALLRDGLKKIAVYRDEKGHLHRFSAVCPHLGCIVQWNDLEKTWDCPCHGSRFKSTGTVLNGPANVNLAKASD